MEHQSGMGKLIKDANYLHGQYGLRAGQVASPVSPINDVQAFDDYIQRCLRTWTVDVVLDDGGYLYGCRIITPQGNTREGLRRMFKFPRQALSERHWVGDRVVVGFLDGSATSPVVLGALYPISITADPTDSLAEAQSEVFVTPDQNEWRDRHEVIDYTDSTNPLPAHTECRNSGKTVEEVHMVFEAPVDGSPPDNTRNLLREVSDSAKTISREHTVEFGSLSERTKDSVYESDTEARNLFSTHTTQTQDGNSFTADITYTDTEARVLLLQHQVQVLSNVVNKLVMQSDRADLLTMSHDTADQLVTIRSDGLHHNFAVVKQDKGDDSNASLQFGDQSVVVLRRASDGEPDAWVILDAAGNVIVQSAFGSSVRLSQGKATLKSGGSSVIVEDGGGVRVLTSDGGALTIKGSAASLTAASFAVTAGAMTMATGALRIGNGSGSTNHIPSAERVYTKLSAMEDRISQIEKWGSSHAHASNGAPPTFPPPQGPTDTFTPAKMKEDSLSSVKGD